MSAGIYRGRLDEEKVSDLHTEFGMIAQEADEMGFILTYHAAREGGGVMDLSGRGISQAFLRELFEVALERNDAHGCTT